LNVKKLAVWAEVYYMLLAQVGHLDMADDGIARRGLLVRHLVRHLVLPGRLANSCHCLHLLADLSPDTFVSIMSQYAPRYKAGRYPSINEYHHEKPKPA
jgi:putative pyruvate formate lyase activating enzyme